MAPTRPIQGCTPPPNHKASPPPRTKKARKTARKEHSTPSRSNVLFGAHIIDKFKLKLTKRALFREAGVTKSTAYNIIKTGDPRTLRNSDERVNKRSRPKLISLDQLRQMDHILQTEDIEGRSLTYDQLGNMVTPLIQANARTIKEALAGTMQYSKCLACQTE